jgi:hypothetical protein
VALSSLQEDRYRRLPSRYPREVAGYESIRRAGRRIAVVEPTLPLSYRWDLLPQWGLDRIPLRGPLPRVGPTVTILDLRHNPIATDPATAAADPSTTAAVASTRRHR